MSDTLPSGTDLQIASNVEFSSPIINTSESYFTSKQIATDALPYGSNLYARTRQLRPMWPPV